MPLQFELLTRKDAKKIRQSWGGNAANFLYLTAPVLSTEKLAQYYIDSALANSESFAFHIVDNGITIGLVKAIVDGHRAQIGYVIDKTYWGKGIATRAVNFIVNELKSMKDLQRIWATCALDNLGSSKVLEKCGFNREGILKNWVIYPAQGGKAHDNYVYSYPLLR